MNFDNTSIISASEYAEWTSMNNKNLFEEVLSLDSEMFFKMVIGDYLVSNIDSHEGNWRFYMNNQTGEIVCMHPLYDHGRAFDDFLMADTEGGMCCLIPGKNMRNAVCYAVRHCDFRCVKSVKKVCLQTKECTGHS